jgi:predicted dehydrogenase
LITHRFPIGEAEDAYRLITSSEGDNYLGVLLTYPETATPVPAVRTIELTPKKTAPEDTIRLGVVGAGNFARAVMLPVLRKTNDIELVGLASASGMGADSTGRKFGFSYVTTDYEELLSDDRINTIAVLTRHHLHSDMVIAGLKANKHVFCEKPLGISSEQLDSVEEALLGSDGLLTVGFNRRFADLSLQLKYFLGPVKESLVVQYRVNAGPLPGDHWLHDPQQGGGRIIGEACHFIDYTTFLTGALPVQINAHALPDDARYHEDNAVLLIEFQDGSIGVITYLANGDRSFPKERVEVFGGGRIAVLDDFRSLELVADGSRKRQQSRLRQDKGHQGEWEALLASVRSGGPPPIPYEELFAVSHATLAALQSLRSRQTVGIGPRENL